MELFKLFGTIAINNSEANNSIKDTTKQAGDAQYSIVESFKKIGTAVMTYFAVDQIISFGENCIIAASNVQAMESQFSQVFGGMEGQASDSLSAIADETGVLENRMKGSYTKIAAFAKTTGMDTEDALNLADRAMIAVADSAAFYDRTLEDTTETLQSFLKGNYENDSALGLSCTETTRNAKANKLYGKSFQELSESQKQLTLLAMVEEANELSGAIGQASRESETWTNQTGNLKQAWADFQAKVGEPILETAISVVEGLCDVVIELGNAYDSLIGFVDMVIEGFESVVEWGKQHSEGLGYIAVALGTLTTAIIAYNAAMAIKNAGGIAELAQLALLQVQIWGLTAAETAHTVATNIATAATTAFGAVMSFVTSPITLVIVGIGALIAVIMLLVNNWDVVSNAAKKAWNFIVDVFKDAANWFNETIVQPIVNFFSNLWENLTIGASNAWESIKTVFSNVTGWFQDEFSEAWAAVKSVFETGGKIFEGIKEAIADVFTTVVNGIIGGINTVIAVPFNAINGILNKIRNAEIAGVKPFSGFWSQNPLAVPEIPMLEEGGILEKGQMGFLEGNGAEAVVPLEKNKKWISKVAQDMDAAMSGASNEKLDTIIDLLEKLLYSLPITLSDALDGTGISINQREFGRLVKGVN